MDDSLHTPTSDWVPVGRIQQSHGLMNMATLDSGGRLGANVFATIVVITISFITVALAGVALVGLGVLTFPAVVAFSFVLPALVRFFVLLGILAVLTVVDAIVLLERGLRPTRRARRCATGGSTPRGRTTAPASRRWRRWRWQDRRKRRPHWRTPRRGEGTLPAGEMTSTSVKAPLSPCRRRQWPRRNRCRGRRGDWTDRLRAHRLSRASKSPAPTTAIQELTLGHKAGEPSSREGCWRHFSKPA
jgi:hypothetical protein